MSSPSRPSPAPPPTLPTKNTSPAASPSPLPASPPKYLTRSVRRQNKARIGGMACLAAHGTEHFREIAYLSAAARKGKRRPTDNERIRYNLPRQQTDTVRAIALGTGRTQSFVVKEALAEYFTSHGAAAPPEPDPPSAGRKPRISKRPTSRK